MSALPVTTYAAFASASVVLNATRFGLSSRVGHFEAGEAIWALVMPAERIKSCPILLAVVERGGAPLVAMIDLAKPIAAAAVGGHRDLASTLGAHEIMSACRAKLDAGTIPVAVADWIGGQFVLSFHTGPEFTVMGHERVAA